MASHYKQRLENHLLEILADLLDREAKDPRIEGVVLTAVELNEDMSVAKVFYMAPAGKDDASAVETGFECGIGLEDFQDLKEGDILESFITEEVARTL